MSELSYRQLLEASWRRELTPAELARLQDIIATSPQAGADWQAQQSLNHLLARLPEPALPSNFSARVVQAAQRVEPRRWTWFPAGEWQGWVKALLPRAAWAGLALLLGLAAVQQYHHWQHGRLARDLARIPVVAALPSSEALQEFDVIQRLSLVGPVPAAAQTVSDEDLLSALQ